MVPGIDESKFHDDRMQVAKVTAFNSKVKIIITVF